MSSLTWLLAVLSLAGDGAAADWPQFLGPTRDGVYAGRDLAETWPEGGPAVVWRAEVGEGFSGPVVAGGRLVLHHRKGDREVVECFDAASGDRRWVLEYPTSYRDAAGAENNGPRATPAIVDGRVVTFGAEGMLHALDLESGHKVWSVDTRESLKAREGYFGLASSPLVEGDRILLNAGGDEAGIAAFHRDTGKVLWTATRDEASYASPVPATIGGRRRVFFFTRSGLKAIDPGSGEVLLDFPWRARAHASVNAATPLVIGDQVFISASYGTGAALLRVKEKTVETVWSSDDVLSCHYATSVHKDGYLYGFDGRQEGRPHLRAVELETGRVAWSKDRFGSGSVTLAGARLLLLMEDGELVLAESSPKAFRQLARAKPLSGLVRAHPALASGRLYARSASTLVCLDLRRKDAP